MSERSKIISITLTTDQLDTLNSGESVRFIIQPPGYGRKQKRAKTVGKTDVDKLVKAWNSDKVVIDAQAGGETKNLPMDGIRVETKRKALQKAIDTVGYDEIIDQMYGYFDCCELGEHRPEAGRNFAYKSLDGLATKLVRCKQKGLKPWWEKKSVGPKKVVDDNPVRTKKIADAFAAKFLGRAKWGKLDNPSTAYRRFWTCRLRLEAVCDKTAMKPRQLLSMALDAVLEQSAGGTVHPGHLASENLWKVVLPQKIKKIMG